MAAPIAPAHMPSSAVTISTFVEGEWGSNASSQLVADRAEQEVGRRRDPAPDDDPVGRDDGHHVGDADPEIASDPGEAFRRADVARPGPHDRFLGRGGPAGGRDLVGASERLEAAPVPAAAPGAVGIDRLVADLAGRPVMALVRTWPSTTMTPPTPVPRVSPIIEEAPRPAPRRSSARPNAARH